MANSTTPMPPSPLFAALPRAYQYQPLLGTPTPSDTETPSTAPLKPAPLPTEHDSFLKDVEHAVGSVASYPVSLLETLHRDAKFGSPLLEEAGLLDLHTPPKNAKEGQATDKDEKEASGTKGLQPISKKEDSLRSTAMYAIAALNGSMLLLQLSQLVSVPARLAPQLFNILGSAINLSSIALPNELKLPAFVAGTALNMGGDALNRSHMDQSNVNPIARGIHFKDNARKSYDILIKARWDSKEFFPHPSYIRKNADGTTTGVAHMVHPGYFEALARGVYWKKFNHLLETTKMPSFLASGIAGASQLLWVTKKMITDSNMRKDAIFTWPQHEEFMKGNLYRLPAAPSYLMAIGAMIPLTLLAATSVVEGGKALYHKAKPLNEDQQEKVEIRKEDSPFSRHFAPTFETMANAVSILPPLVGLMTLQMMRKEANGHQTYVMSSGLANVFRISPKANSNLLAMGNWGAILSALTATMGDITLLPRAASHVADVCFMAFSGLSTIANARTAYAGESKAMQGQHLAPSPDAVAHARQIAEAEKKNLFSHWDSTRVPHLGDPISSFRNNKKDTK